MCLILWVEVITGRTTLVCGAAELMHVKTVFLRVAETFHVYLDLRRTTQQLRPHAQPHAVIVISIWQR